MNFLLLPVASGWLGVTVQDVTPRIAFELGLGASHGAMVAMVRQGGPAARAGIKQKDLIIVFNGEPVDDAAHLGKLVKKLSPGLSVKLKILRGEEELLLFVVLGDNPRESV